jgi:hypothetical protein
MIFKLICDVFEYLKKLIIPKTKGIKERTARIKKSTGTDNTSVKAKIKK